MITAILGTKLGQSQTFTDDGRRIPVTRIQAGPCWVVAVSDRGSYQSIQLGFGNLKTITKPLAGHVKKAGLETKPRFLREVRIIPDRSGSTQISENPSPISGNLPKVGDTITINDVFKVGDAVRVTGISKGKGFAGVVKRHGFAGGPRTHGQSDRERAPGSIGQTTTPGRVYRGKRMAGHMGVTTVTIRGLKVVTIDPEKNILTVKGLVPGAKQGLLLIAKETRREKVYAN